MQETVNASPTKRFFIANLTRDLSLEDAILDLVDNSIDAFIRTRDVDVSPRLLDRVDIEFPSEFKPRSPLVEIKVSKEEFRITDWSGGIDIERARDEVFRLGRVDMDYRSSLGVYGIGLKRALFKIGREITVESHTVSSGFMVNINVDKWMEDDDNWEFPLTRLQPVESLRDSGTTIIIRRLNPEVQLRIGDKTLLQNLKQAVASTYSLFLERFLTVALNGQPVAPNPLPIGSSGGAPPAHREFTSDEVSVEIFAGLAERIGGEWAGERAGWYVLCNGRVVVAGDKTELTGWGVWAPQYQSKYRGFVGIAFFFSEFPAKLPWTTTKRGLNLESQVYQMARREMALIARPVLTFLNNMYPSEAPSEIEERKIADTVRRVDIAQLAQVPERQFPTTPPKPRRQRTTVSVQYKAEKADIERIRNHLGHPEWGASQVGRYTLDYYLKVEGL